MRVPKYRAWDKRTKEMYDVIEMGWRDGFAIRIGYLENHSWGSRPRSIQEVDLLEFTGLRDKNGKEIYEGDVVHYRYAPGPGMWNADFQAVISWDSTGFYMSPLPGQSGIRAWLVSVPGAFGDGTHNGLFEVIGNIYENPELVKP